MDLERAKAIIAQRMGNRQDLLEQIENELQLAVEERLERDPGIRPWYLLTNTPSTAVSTVANQAYVSVPSDFIAEYEYGFLRIVNASGGKTFLSKADYKYLEINKGIDDDGNINTGLPTHYTVINDRIQLYPTPDAVYTLEMMYYQKSSSLKDSPETNPHLLNAADWLIGQAGMEIASYKQHIEMAKLFAGQAQDGKRRVIAATEDRLLQNMWTGGASPP